MCIKPIFVASFLLALATQAMAQEPACENEASVAELRARLAACTAAGGPCRSWLGSLDTAVQNFKAGTMAASTCTTTLRGLSNLERRYQRDMKMPSTPSAPGGGGGGGRADGAFL